MMHGDLRKEQNPTGAANQADRRRFGDSLAPCSKGPTKSGVDAFRKRDDGQRHAERRRVPQGYQICLVHHRAPQNGQCDGE